MRVIAGALGGRRLEAPRGRNTRPTSDRVREAIFSILGDLDQMRVLDLYAGSGALGIEALSRGASYAVFVENSKPALLALRGNITSLSLEAQSRVLSTTVERCLGALSKLAPFDLVLCDPPWANLDAAVQALTPALASQIRSDGRLILEHAAADEPQLPASLGLELNQRRRWGDSAASFFTRIAGNTP